MSEDAKQATAFSTGSGLWQFKHMPFGLCNAPATFQKLMNMVLAGFGIERVMTYLDDILVISQTFEEHLRTLAEVLRCLQKHGLKIKPQKCQLFQSEVEFLGHVVTSEGLAPLSRNIKAIQDYEPPKTAKGVQRFMGMVNFYRKFIPNCSVIMKPIAASITGKKLTWTGGCQQAFEQLKSVLISPPILAFPNFKSGEPLCLYTDASQFGVGAHLTQIQDGRERTIAYISRTLNQAEINYSVLDKELTAIRWAVKRLKPFLWGRHFIVKTDHRPLTYLQGMRLLDGRLARTLEELGDYDFELQYLPGKHNVIADSLSRDALAQEVSFGVEDSKVLEDMDEIHVKGGADTLFRCFARVALSSEEDHAVIRTQLIDHILEFPHLYNLQLERVLRKQLRLMRFPGTLPIFEVIQAFSNFIKAPVFVYEELLGFVVYRPSICDPDVDPCVIRSYDSIYFTLLIPKYPDMNLLEYSQQPSVVSTEQPLELYALEVDLSPSDDIVYDISGLDSLDMVRDTGPDRFLQREVYEITTRSKSKKNVTFKDDPVSEVIPDLSWRQNCDLDTLRSWQQSCKPLARLVKIFSRDQPDLLVAKRLCTQYKSLKKYKVHLSHLGIDNDGLLVRRTEVENLTNPVFPYLVPFSPAVDLVRLAHVANAHVGRDKLHHLIRNYIFHPRLADIVADVTRTCDHCQTHKAYAAPHSPPVLKIRTSTIPFELVHVDLLEMPHVGNKARYVLNAVDQCTKWLASQPLKDKTSLSCSLAMEKIIASFPSLPDTIISDNGREFTGEPFASLLRQYGVKQQFVSPYSPQSNGLVERINRTLLNLLSGLCQPTSWEEMLCRAVVTYNNTFHKEIKCTPSEFLTRVASKLPIHGRRESVWKKGSDKFTPYPVNSLVGVRKRQRYGVQSKMSPRYRGPFKVLKVFASGKAYEVADVSNPDYVIKVHFRDVRPWYNKPKYLQETYFLSRFVFGACRYRIF